MNTEINQAANLKDQHGGDQLRERVFSKYQVFVIVIVSLLQFTVILDFIVMAPLGAQLIRILKITPSQFGWVVSAYAFSAGIAGILAAVFADRFDRKKMLLFFYTGFIAGTLLCGIAAGYQWLLLARVVTGLFGGVLFSINMAIVADLFPLEKRGRVMGFVQMAFAVSQVAGIPVGLFLAGKYGWHMPFLMIAGLGIPVGLVILRWMKPIDLHLKERAAQRPLVHLVRTASQMRYVRAFLATALLSTGGFLMMPYSSAFLVHNVGVDEKVLPIVFVVAGFVGLFTGPLIGRLSDRIGKFRMFIAGSVLQQLVGGIASVVGGWIIGQNAEGLLVHYDMLGWVTIGAFFVCAVLMYAVNSYIMSKTAAKETLSFS